MVNLLSEEIGVPAECIHVKVVEYNSQQIYLYGQVMPDGLAKSSRNAYLDAEDRRAALALYRSLRRAQELVDAGETDARLIVEEMGKVLAAEPRVAPDYAVVVEPARLSPAQRVTPGCVALVAARVGSTRLIDNWIIAPPGTSDDERIQLALARCSSAALSCGA